MSYLFCTLNLLCLIEDNALELCVHRQDICCEPAQASSHVNNCVKLAEGVAVNYGCAPNVALLSKAKQQAGLA